MDSDIINRHSDPSYRRPVRSQATFSTDSKPRLSTTITSVSPDEEPFRAAYSSPNGSSDGLPGAMLFRLSGSVRWYTLAMIVYGLAAIGVTVFVITCPVAADPASRVLPTGHVAVDQFYAGLLLSGLLTPAATIIRKACTELGLLHPFALASKTPVDMEDIDIMTDPGIQSMMRLFRYDWFMGVVQAFLLASGAVLIPIGTLLVYTGTYAPPLTSEAAVGMPTADGQAVTLNIPLGMAQGGGTDFVLEEGFNLAAGGILRRSGVLADVPNQLGPVATPNLTYTDGVRYDGILTYRWTSGYEMTEEILFTEGTVSDAWYFNINFPNNYTVSNLDAWNSKAAVHNVTNNDGSITTYYAVIGVNSQTLNYEEAIAAGAINTTGGAWISRVACTPTFSWEVSSCTWQNASMTACTTTPGANTTAIDERGLAELEPYLSFIPLALAASNDYGFGFQILETALAFDTNATSSDQMQAPLLSSYDNLYGLCAEALVTLLSSGYFGVASVPTVGSTPKPAYLARTYILALVLLILVLSPVLTVALLCRHRAKRVPIRRATFLTLANAVRGPTWDSALHGGCVMPASKLRECHRGVGVMYGIDEHMPDHVGFAHQVTPVQPYELYSGVGRPMRRTSYVAGND